MSKDIWGPSIWNLFHTLAEKLKPEHSDEIQHILFHFRQVCHHLPCPSCQQHATDIINKARLDKVITREDLKDFFLMFHNIVNKKINKPCFSKEDCDKRYSLANTVNIVNHFIAVMKSNQISNEKTMMNTLTRHLCVDSFSKYIRQNGYKFNP
jgi:hypothetical protein